MREMKEIGGTDLLAKRDEYRCSALEGGEGYNPYQIEIDRRDAESFRALNSLEDKKYRLTRKLVSLDSSISRESGTFDATAVDALKAEIDALQTEIDAPFIAEWTREVALARRDAWNRTAISGKYTRRNLGELERKMGFTARSMKRAISMHTLPKWQA